MGTNVSATSKCKGIGVGTNGIGGRNVRLLLANAPVLSSRFH